MTMRPALLVAALVAAATVTVDYVIQYANIGNGGDRRVRATWPERHRR